MQINPWNPDKAPLQQVISEHFKITTIKKECTVEQFQVENNLKKGGASVFIEYSDPVKKDLIRDVILKEKVMTRVLQHFAVLDRKFALL